ncbi:hypothetical protein SNQ23_001808 [Cronobacter dublinensis]|uniref:hypothetical protein n=1 Tax=Cronobacter dublinensis TaxID=413497 RepID=UPI00124A42B4|nr:hypothetical protein [Cronobacter dublinensis]ELY6211982.1 hypothetical protein [Cronobacter dublinensis]MDI6442033.1 hypothetical protein [Cronobacter dublinensis]
MENKAKEVIHCAYCHTELTKGVQVCRTCLATVKYGVPPTGLMLLVWLIGMVGGVLYAMYIHSAPAFFLGFVFMAIGLIALKAIYADRISFHRR